MGWGWAGDGRGRASDQRKNRNWKRCLRNYQFIGERINWWLTGRRGCANGRSAGDNESIVLLTE